MAPSYTLFTHSHFVHRNEAEDGERGRGRKRKNQGEQTGPNKKVSWTSDTNMSVCGGLLWRLLEDLSHLSH